MSSPRRSTRVLQSQNKRVLMSPEEPANKRVKNEDKKFLDKEVKEEELGKSFNEENTTPTTAGSTLSKYEQMVQSNIAARQKLLESMGILQAKEELDASVQESKKKKTIYRGIIREKKSPEPVIRRRSLRQQNLTPDGVDLPLPSDEQVAKAEKSHQSPTHREHSKPPPGPGPLMDYYHASNKVECESLIGHITTAAATTSSSSSTISSMKIWGGSSESVLRQMKKMQIEEEHVVKVVPDRIFSVQIHPTLEKTLVLVGGKWGQLGIWDVGRNDESNGAYCFHPHSRPINCLSVSSSSPHLAHSTSYDSSLRQTDLAAGVVQELYDLGDDQRNSFLSWHSEVDSNTFLLGASLGRVIQVDRRVGGGKVKQFLAHDKRTVKVITRHPHQHHYYATGSNDACVSLWDLRSHKNNKPLSSVIHGRSVQGLEFSQTGNTLISTAMDDYLRFITFDGTSLTVSRKIKHDNQTGRWLTTFKARFVPTRDDLVYVGSMAHPRRIEVWGGDGMLQHQFKGPALGTVNCVVALHPQRYTLAGCNSSGKVYVFM